MPDEKKKCYAPVFRGAGACTCRLRVLLMALLLPVQIVVCILIALITFGAFDAGCCIRRYIYQMSHCREGNSDPNVLI